MRKFKIRINNKWQTILAKDKTQALIDAKVSLGYKSTDVLMNYTLEFFNGVEDLHERCKKIREVKGLKPVEVIEFWGKPSEKTDYGYHFEILREDNYFDTICFEWDDDELAEKIYKELEIYNREITPLEKYQASF